MNNKDIKILFKNTFIYNYYEDYISYDNYNDYKYVDLEHRFKSKNLEVYSDDINQNNIRKNDKSKNKLFNKFNLLDI